MKNILLYHLYIVNNWKEISGELLLEVPHDDIYVNLSFDWRYLHTVFIAYFFFKKIKKVRRVFVTPNDARYGELLGFNKFRSRIDFTSYQILTYMHGKGVTRPGNTRIDDWRRLMRYFIIDRFPLCVKVFEEGYCLYGVNLSRFNGADTDRKHSYKYSDFWFRGNFVSVNLDLVRQKFVSQPIVIEDYYSIEGFWGTLCSFDLAFCAHESNVSHYKENYPAYFYIND